MTPTEFRAQLARLGLSQAGAARVLGQDERTARRYASGERDVPEPVIRLLWACERDPGLLDALSKQNRPWRRDLHTTEVVA